MRWIPFVSLLFLLSCNNKKNAPDVSSIKTDVTIIRFDNDFFALDTTKVQEGLQRIEKKYPAFLPLYFKYFAPVKDIAQQQNLPFDSALIRYYRFIKPLAVAASQRFADMNDVEKSLSQNLRYVKYYFPSFVTPAVLTSVESLNPDNPTEIYGTSYYQDTLVISLQMFLGKDYPAYDPAQYPDYLRRRFQSQYIVPNSIKAIVEELYPDSSQSATLVERMIEKGKQWWLMKKFLPQVPDSLITGYSTQQTEWVAGNEGNVWGSVVQNENLFSIEPATIQNYIGEGPFTQTLPHDNSGGGAPGNIGPWLGWRMIIAFEEKNSKLTVDQILHTTAKKIFEEAKYKPK